MILFLHIAKCDRVNATRAPIAGVSKARRGPSVAEFRRLIFYFCIFGVGIAVARQIMYLLVM